jgi:hypothetical protein
MSRFDDDQDQARKVENKFVSLVALGRDFTGKINNFVETETREASKDIGLDLDLESNDVEENREKNAVRATAKFIDLGDFSEIKSCSSFQFIANINGKVATTCPDQNLREEQNKSPNNHVFVHHCSGRMIDIAADCTGLDPVKNYYDFLETRSIHQLAPVLS